MKLKAILFCLAMLLLAGCGPKTYEITGQVKMDGQPVPEGHIAFSSDEGVGGNGGGPITNGQYKALVTAGKTKVRITASKLTPLAEGEENPYGHKEEMRSYIPNKYNASTTLEANITGPANLDYDLKSDPK